MLNQNSDRSEIPRTAIKIGDLIDGNPEYIVVYDMLGLHPFHYNKDTCGYEFVSREFLWRIPLAACQQTEEMALLPLPCGCDFQHFSSNGLDNLGYVSTLVEHPELIEYSDNPGLLILLIANLPQAKSILSMQPSRVEIARKLARNNRIQKYHIKWLKKVRPEQEKPAVLAQKIIDTLLKICSPRKKNHANTDNLKLLKLIAHQTRWTSRGLEFVKSLVNHADVKVADMASLLSTFNGEEPELFSGIRRILWELQKEIGVHDPMHPSKLRMRYFAKQSDLSRLCASKGFLTTISKAHDETQRLECCLLFLNDEDIPVTLIPGNQYVRPLDTFSKIRRHAQLAGNCLWSIDILSSILFRSIDLYAVYGDNLYTISVDRCTLNIRVIEAEKGSLIKPSDLGIIADWFKQSTTLPRNLRDEDCPVHLEFLPY